MTAPNSGPTSRMSAATRERVQAELADGRDSTNPAFTFSCTSSTLLLAIASGLLDANELARQELADRGLDNDGVWCGFDRAREIHLRTRVHDHFAAPTAVAESAAAEIAQRILRIESLEAVGSDRQDFFEIACWQIKEALAAAFAAGKAAK